MFNFVTLCVDCHNGIHYKKSHPEYLKYRSGLEDLMKNYNKRNLIEI